jgi:hypothetical protein
LLRTTWAITGAGTLLTTRTTFATIVLGTRGSGLDTGTNSSLATGAAKKASLRLF